MAAGKEVLLSKNGYKYKGLITIVDVEDFDKVNKYNWSADNHGHTFYAKTFIGDKIVYLHNFLSGFKETDHRDRNGLNNKRGNLRESTRQQNMMNKDKQKGVYTSIYKGVMFRKKRNKWQALITVNDKRIYLGLHEKESDAALAYNKKATELYGNFAKINKI